MWPRIAGEDWHHVIKTANQETVLVLQIESQRAHENIDAIKQIPGIDVLLVGPLDLSASVGKITETGCREVQEIMRDVPRRLEGSSIVPGTTLMEVSDIQEKISWGYIFLLKITHRLAIVHTFSYCNYNILEIKNQCKI